MECLQAPPRATRFAHGVTLFARRIIFSDLAGSLFAGYKCHGLGHAQVNKLDKLNAVNDPNSFLFLHVSTKMFVYT